MNGATLLGSILIAGSGAYGIVLAFNAIGWNYTTPYFWIGAIPLSYIWGLCVGSVTMGKIHER